MANLNSRNFGIAIGRLGRDPKVFTNQDGSRKIMLSLGVRQNFTNAQNERGTDWLDMEAFVPANAKNGVFDLLHKGMQIQATYTVTSSTYNDKTTGEPKHKQALRIVSVELLDSRKAAEAPAMEAPAPAMAAPAPTAMPAGVVAPAPGDMNEFDA